MGKLLAIDVGNTQTVLGVYEGSELLHMWRIGTKKADTSDELRLKLTPLLAADDLDVAAFEGAVLASVVPALTAGWKIALTRLLGCEPLVCDAEPDTTPSPSPTTTPTRHLKRSSAARLEPVAAMPTTVSVLTFSLTNLA